MSVVSTSFRGVLSVMCHNVERTMYDSTISAVLPLTTPMLDHLKAL
jgi:hypothetical protein